ncbi:MAG: hypothetical protein NC412_10905 [Roseburia sp.]|nr:hypothetical protein [Roseburia sp.]MCM1279330.1 hypothetical protein [Robinsoniella sp.]
MKMEQTNRTILFEEINPNKADLFTLIGDIKEQESLTDEMVEQIHRELEVNSFQQLIDKFEPGIYMYLNTSACNVSFSRQLYSLEGHEASKITLDQRDSLLSVILELMDSKKNRQYLLKNFNYILDSLVSKDRKKKFLKQRNKCITMFHEKKTAEAKKLCQNMQQEHNKGLFLLTLFLQGAYEVMVTGNPEGQKDRFIGDAASSNLVTPIALSENLQKREARLLEEEQKEYKAFLEGIMEKIEKQQPVCHRELFTLCMELPTIKTKGEVEKLQSVYEKYLAYYSDIIRMFWIQGKPLLEQLLGIKMFFEQYGGISEGMSPSLVISNVSVKDILSMDARKKLQIYLETVNQKNYGKNTLWYGIIPNISLADHEKEKNLRERFQGTKERIQYPSNDCQEVSVLLQILAEYKIQTFISPQVTDKTTYQWLKQHGMENWMETLKEYEGMEKLEYVIPCYPNCMVIPKEQAQLILGHNTSYDELKEQVRIQGEKKLWLDGLGIEAAYITAGLFAACQCPKYLEAKYKNRINAEFPGVAYRITEEDHALMTPTTMAREVLTFPEELIREIQRRAAGVVLIPCGGKIVASTDRTLAYLKGINDEIYHIQTISYIQRVIRSMTQDYKENLIKQFFQNRPGSIRMQWMENKKYINSIMKEGETMEYDIEEKNNTCTFTVMFEKGKKGETVHIAK